jgi:septal ring factor EnvC (AmiA/AmiB activator)
VTHEEKSDLIRELRRRLQHLEEALQRQDNAIIALKALLTRAADALERVDKNWPNEDYGADAKLISKLRKAAE